MNAELLLGMTVQNANSRATGIVTKILPPTPQGVRVRVRKSDGKSAYWPAPYCWIAPENVVKAIVESPAGPR